jgi:putative nucleotidyltransferase with HDIG domain
MSTHALDEPELLRATFADELSPLAPSERRAELVVGGGFVAGAFGLALLAPTTGRFLPLVAAMYVCALALAGHVRFHIGSGFTVPTQMVFVPMLFALPAALVPLLAAFALALGMLPDVVRRRTPWPRLLLGLGNSWFALGPAAVLVFAHERGPGVSVLILVAALGAQLSGDFLGNALREWLRGDVSIAELGSEMVTVYLIDIALAPVGLAVAFATEGRDWALLLVLPLLALLSVFSRERRARLEQLIELNDAYRGTALVLGDVVESDDAYTGVHCKGVVELALAVSDEFGLDHHRRRCVEFGALLHDVGKLAVPNEIINKRGKLDEREWMIIKTHTIEGQQLLDRVGGIMSEVGAVVRSSHERWDGGGYPDGLKEKEIPLEARIVAACDAFNAMTTTRSYRSAMPFDAAIEELRANAGRQFDPAVVDALVRVLGAGKDSHRLSVLY